jgi:hypothetical protein
MSDDNPFPVEIIVTITLVIVILIVVLCFFLFYRANFTKFPVAFHHPKYTLPVVDFGPTRDSVYSPRNLYGTSFRGSQSSLDSQISEDSED